MTRLADALVLTMTRGVSLADWDRLGLIEREWALYDRLSCDYDRILIVSSGGADDVALGREHCPGAQVVCDVDGLGRVAFERAAPAMVAERLGAARSVVVKTNQMEGGTLACAIASRLRQDGRPTTLVARGGYLYSRFVSDRQGSASDAARAAASEEARLCAAADLIVCTTPEMARDLAWRYQIEDEGLRVVPNYVLMEGSASSPPSQGERHAGEILYAGQLIERKRVDLLIEAVARLDDGLGATLSVVGEGPERERLEALAQSLGVRARFEPRLPHRELWARFRRCAVYAQASRLEGHPKTINEAMAAGCAVVATDAPGTRDVLAHERTGLLVGADLASLGAAIDRLLRDDAMRRSLGAAAHAWARANVAIERVEQLERDAHRAATERFQTGARITSVEPQVRFEPALLDASLESQVSAFANAIGGFWKRSEANAGARFVMALDEPLYRLQGHAAIEANGGLHPKHELTRYHDFFCERIGKDERVLDLGSGVGALAVAIAQRTNARVTGMDLDPKNVAKSQHRAREAGVDHLVRFELADITTELAAGEHDTIILSNVLEHLNDRPMLLVRWREIYGCERFLIRVPMLERDWRVPWKKWLGVEWRLDDTHETEYIEDELKSDLREAGLSASTWVTRWGEFWVQAEARQ